MTRSVADCSADAHYVFVREIAQPADGEIKEPHRVGDEPPLSSPRGRDRTDRTCVPYMIRKTAMKSATVAEIS